MKYYSFLFLIIFGANSMNDGNYSCVNTNNDRMMVYYKDETINKLQIWKNEQKSSQTKKAKSTEKEKSWYDKKND